MKPFVLSLPFDRLRVNGDGQGKNTTDMEGPSG